MDCNELGEAGNQELATLESLEELQLDENEISDLTPVAGLTKLAVLSSFQNNVHDLHPLAGLTNLRILFASYNEIHDLSPLGDLTNLEHLWLLGNCRTASPGSGQAATDCLQALRVTDNEITSLAPITNLTVLELLDAAVNLIADISPLAELENLQSVTIFDNPVGSLGPLAANTDFPAGPPFTFSYGNVIISAGDYPNLSIGYDCIQDDGDWEEQLATLNSRSGLIEDFNVHNMRPECTVQAPGVGELDVQMQNIK